mgnify:CR=1 FL=1
MSTTMSSRDLVLDALRRIGRQVAEKLQEDAPGMTGTEVVAQQDYLPKFDHTRQYKDFKAGYVCRSSAGRAVKLIQPYDSMTYTQEPEELPAQWGFYWSNDPKKALPFIALSTSPYNTGDCCTYEGHVWRSGQDGNVWAPGSVGVKWDDLGTIEEVQG